MKKIPVLQAEFVDNAQGDRHFVSCFVSLPKNDKTPWPYAMNGVCPRGDLYYRLDGGPAMPAGISAIWQFNSAGDSWPVYWSASDKFKVETPFKVLELFVKSLDTDDPDFCIGRFSPKYPVTLTFDLKSWMYTSRLKRGGKFEFIAEDWTTTAGKGRTAGSVANNVQVTFGRYYGYRIEDVCRRDPDYAVFLMTRGSVGSNTANANLQSCQAWIEKNFDWRSHKEIMDVQIAERAVRALPKGSTVNFTGTCEYREKTYGRVDAWGKSHEELKRLNFDCILIHCDNGMTLKVEKFMKKLMYGRVSGTAVIDWYGAKTDTYGVSSVTNVKNL